MRGSDAPLGAAPVGVGLGGPLPEWSAFMAGADQRAPGGNGAAYRPPGTSADTPWVAEGRAERPAAGGDARPLVPPEGGTVAWDAGGLWGAGGSANIWSSNTGAAHEAGRARRSIDMPIRSARSEEPPVFVRAPGPAERRRSLDSMSGLHAIWQAQQQQQQQQQQQHGLHHPPPQPPFSQPPYTQLHHAAALGQQLGGLRLQEGPLPVSLPPPGVHAGFPSGGLGAAGGLPPALAAQLLPDAAGLGLGLGGLGAAQLQAALADPATARLLRARLEAAALPYPQLLQPGLEERLLLAQQAGLLGQGLRQPPPPPPPRSARGPLPGVLQPKPAAAAARKPAVAAARTPARDRAAMLGGRPKADMAALDRVLTELVASLRPSAEELAKQQAAFAKVSRLLTARWPHAKVHQFGSTANALSICNNNDIDVCLEMVEPEGEPNFRSQLVEEMGDLLTDAGMANVLPLPKARVPVVKFAVPDTGTKVDVSVNNMLALTNTRLLADYSAVDARLGQLAFVVKHWAKRRAVNDSYRGTLSSYAYVLMCIHHLQSREPPVLPCLQAIQPPTHIRTIGRWCCDYHDKPMPGFGAANTESLAELVWSFFENWAWRHDYNNAVVSVRTGALLTKAQKDWTRRIGNERHLICIEDPFETSHDLGRTIDRQTSGVLHKEFERAACVLRDQAEPLAQLFEPYRAGKAP